MARPGNEVDAGLGMRPNTGLGMRLMLDEKMRTVHFAKVILEWEVNGLPTGTPKCAGHSKFGRLVAISQCWIEPVSGQCSRGPQQGEQCTMNTIKVLYNSCSSLPPTTVQQNLQTSSDRGRG